MLPKWALDKARSMNLNDILDLVRKCPVPNRLLSPINKLILRLQTGDVTNRQKIAIFAALVYLVTFWDIIPDIPIVGFVDDLAVLMSVVRQIES